MSTMNAEETKRWKAKNLRYKKPMVKELNLDTIREKLFDIQGECEEVRWYTDSEDGEDSLLNALDGNEDEVYEFKVAFAYLCEECEAMQVDLNEEWIPECFDLLFVVAGAGDQFGGLLGYDVYEKGKCGFYLYVPDEMDDTLPVELKHLLQITKSLGCEILCLDSDGSVLPNMEHYNW